MHVVVAAEEPQPEPEQETFVDAADLLRRERTRKRKLLLSVGGAVVTTIVWVWWLESSRSDARQWGALADAYAWGRGALVFLVAVLAAGVASAFPRRTWFRFLTAYAIAMAFGLVTVAQRARLHQKYDALGSNAVSKAEADERDLRQRQLWLRNDFKQYGEALAKNPPFSAPALESVRAIDVSIRHLDNLANIIDLTHKLNTEIESKAPSGASPQAAGLRQLLDAQKHDFEVSRKALTLLRAHFGEWGYTDRGVTCDDPALQQELEASVTEATEAAQRIRKLESRIDMGNSDK